MRSRAYHSNATGTRSRPRPVDAIHAHSPVTYLASRKYTPSDVSAVIISYNSLPDLVTCIRSARAEGINDLVVVENGDADRTRAELTHRLPGVEFTFVGDGVNHGYGGGVNVGARECRRPLLLVLNPDVVLSPGTVQRLIDTLVEQSAAMVGPLVLSGDREVFESARTFPSAVDAGGHALLGHLWPANPWTRRYHVQAQLPSATASAVDWVQGSCLLMQREEFQQVGGFDESYFMYLEDTDLCWRLVHQGRRVMFEPRAVITHYGGTSTRRHPIRMALAHHRSALLFWWRSRSRRQRVAVPLAASLLAVRLLVVLGAQIVLKQPTRAMRRAVGAAESGDQPLDMHPSGEDTTVTRVSEHPAVARPESPTLVLGRHAQRGA